VPDELLNERKPKIMIMPNLILSTGMGHGVLPWSWILGTITFLYLGPQTILPLASALAAIIGVALIGWQYVMRFGRRAHRFLKMKISRSSGVEPQMSVDAPLAATARAESHVDKGTPHLTE
jgi:hypothetical protein